MVAAERAFPIDSLTRRVSWDFAEWTSTARSSSDCTAWGSGRHVFATMPALDGVADALWRLSDAGVWIRIITHRLVTNWGPHGSSPTPWSGWTPTGSRTGTCASWGQARGPGRRLRGGRPHNVAALRAGGNTVVVFDQPYNRELDGPGRRAGPNRGGDRRASVLVHTGAFSPQLPASGRRRPPRPPHRSAL